MKKIFLFCSILINFLLADSIKDDLVLKDFLKAQNKMKFTPQQRACSTCDWTISFLIENNNVDSILQDSMQNNINDSSLLNNLSANSRIPNKMELRNMESNLQNSAISNLFNDSSEDDTESKDSIQYDFLGQRNTPNPLLMQENQGIQNTNSPFKVMHAVFIKKDILQAYNEVLRHKHVFTCMYCGTLDVITKELPISSKTQVYHNVKYSYTPLNNAYKIEISDNVCGVVDTLIFTQDKNGAEMWLYSRVKCV